MAEPHTSTRDTAIGRARRALADIAAAWPEALDPPHIDTTGPRSVPSSRPPASLTRADTTRVLAWWAAHTRARNPDTRTVHMSDVPALTAWLNDHAPVIAAEHDGGNMPSLIEDLERCVRHLQDLINPYPRLKIGDCHLTRGGDTPGPDNVHEPQCRGAVYADTAADESTRYRYAACDTCGSEAAVTWWRQQWEPDPPELVTTTRLVKLLAAQGIHTTEATMRWRLHAGLVSRSGTTRTGGSLWDVTAVVYALNRSASAATVGDRGTPTPAGGS